ncbi:MAG: sigma-70 family RNA polymerase sigma factor [Aeromicrobium sp.]
MDPYIRRLSAIPRLDAKSERALALLACGGDVDARDQLITASLPLVVMRARRLGLHGQRLLDAVQAGTIGLIEAVDRFDPGRGCRLATYAWWWIGQSMSRTFPVAEFPSDFARADLADRVSVLAEDLLEGLDEELAEVLSIRYGSGSEPGRTLTRAEVAQRLGLSVSQVRTKEAKALSHLRQRLAKVGHRASHQHGEDGPL